MMRCGIPAYRLPRDVLDAELDRIAALGVRFAQGHRVTDLAAERAEGLRHGSRYADVMLGELSARMTPQGVRLCRRSARPAHPP
jgi:NADPH-dependent glutamate synthase beta subunit-like oxidoreductase